MFHLVYKLVIGNGGVGHFTKFGRGIRKGPQTVSKSADQLGSYFRFFKHLVQLLGYSVSCSKGL